MPSELLGKIFDTLRNLAERSDLHIFFDSESLQQEKGALLNHLINRLDDDQALPDFERRFESDGRAPKLCKVRPQSIT